LQQRSPSILKAWSHIVHTLIPNAAVLHRHLSIFAKACNATEVILFERATFLVIATSSSPSPHTLGTVPPVVDAKAGGLDPDSIASHRLDPTRYERTSELIIAFKYCCSRVRGEFHTLEMELHDFSAVLDEMTRNTYVMVIVHDPTIGTCLFLTLALKPFPCPLSETAAVKLNIRLARRKFEELQGDSLIA
jgi:Ras-related GTP-binding protein A/B